MTASSVKVNLHTVNVTFKQIDTNVNEVTNFKRFYPGLKVLGKNFLISTIPRTAIECPIKRHYSICWALDKQIKSNLVKCLDSNSIKDFDKTLYVIKDTNKISLTIKNYNTESGLSKKIHTSIPEKHNSYKIQNRSDSLKDAISGDQPNNEFLLKGPIGKGLMCESTGNYVIFAAGTGVLCFLDLIAMLALHYLKVIDKVEPTNERIDLDNFKLTLYVSFPSASESVARDLL